RALVLRSGSEAGWVNYLTRFVPLNLQAHPSPRPSPLRKGRGGIVSRFLAIQASWERVHCRPSQGEGRDGGTELTPFPRCQESWRLVAGPKFNTDNRRGMRFIPRAFMPKRTDIHSVLIIGAGPIIIGQACEFDYSGTQACKALKEEGYRVVLVNSNPATIMTDPEFADRTYIEPITAECIEKIIVRELEEMKRMGVPVGVAASRQSAANSTGNQRRSAETPLQVPHKLVLL